MRVSQEVKRLPDKARGDPTATSGGGVGCREDPKKVKVLPKKQRKGVKKKNVASKNEGKNQKNRRSQVEAEIKAVERTNLGQKPTRSSAKRIAKNQ